MNTPTHIAAGALFAQLMINWLKLRSKPSPIWGCYCLGWGIASHLLLDLVPHYAWVVYLPGIENFPFHWLIKEAALGLLVAVPLVYITRERWGCIVLGMIGAIYPDIEKVLYLDFGIPDTLVLFGWHSTSLSSLSGTFSTDALIVIELALVVGLLIATSRLVHNREKGID